MNDTKIIHYCWFGGAEKPDIVKRCILSWKKFMPEYEIIEWNETNYDCKKNKYIQEAYNLKKWAFVSDYARFDILYKFGGIYLDTDVELLRSIPESYISNSSFTACEPSGKVSPGLIFSCNKNHPIAKEMIDIYNDELFLDDNNQPICKTVNSYITEILSRYGYKEIDELQKLNNITIYPSQYFCGYDLDVMEPMITDKTISIHHYAGTWNDKSLKRRLQQVLKKFIGVENYRKLLKIVRMIKK